MLGQSLYRAKSANSALVSLLTSAGTSTGSCHMHSSSKTREHIEETTYLLRARLNRAGSRRGCSSQIAVPQQCNNDNPVMELLTRRQSFAKGRGGYSNTVQGRTGEPASVNRAR
jgi:hypothetical protein